MDGQAADLKEGEMLGGDLVGVDVRGNGLAEEVRADGPRLQVVMQSCRVLAGYWGKETKGCA